MKAKMFNIANKMYRRIFDIYAKLKYPFVKSFYSFPKIKTIEETLEDICINRKSISRFGDGELHMMSYINIGFQQYNKVLSERLKEVISDFDNDHCLIALPSSLHSINSFNSDARSVFKILIGGYYHHYQKFINKDFLYSNAFITRPYMDYLDKSASEQNFRLLKKVWHDRNVVIVEGNNTKFGIGNDLLQNSKSVSRIICPSKNAFDIYNKIFEFVLHNIQKNNLILIALGPTATVLAYDLSKAGYQSIDIGHADIEYEWFLRKECSKVAIDNKDVNEVKDGYVINTSKNNTEFPYLEKSIYKL